MYILHREYSMKSIIFESEENIRDLHAFLKGLPHAPNLGALEEQMQIPEIRSIMRLWYDRNEVVAFAYVDIANNLRHAVTPGHPSDSIEQEILNWGLECMRQRNARNGQAQTLDASCPAGDSAAIGFLKKHGFQIESVRTLEYTRLLLSPIEVFPFPPGFFLRCAAGEQEVDALVALHRAAFGTNYMTVEERLAIMRTPGYIPELDLVATAPDGKLCAFCICEVEADDRKSGFTDPIGVLPDYQRRGLGKAILSTGLHALQERGVTTARLGTSSGNIPMQRLAESVGFTCVSENLWFSRSVS